MARCTGNANVEAMRFSHATHLGDACAGSLREAQRADAQLGHVKQAHIIGHGGDQHGNLVLLHTPQHPASAQMCVCVEGRRRGSTTFSTACMHPVRASVKPRSLISEARWSCHSGAVQLRTLPLVNLASFESDSGALFAFDIKRRFSTTLLNLLSVRLTRKR